MTRLCRIGDCTDRCITWNPISQPSGKRFRYIDLSSVNKNTKEIDGAIEISCSDAPSRARQLVSAGDIIVSTVRPNLNGVAIIPRELDGATASTGYTVLRPITSIIDGSYLFQWVRSPIFVAEMVRLATGANYPAVSDRIVRESKIPLPSLAEQRKIALVLEKANSLCLMRREIGAKLDALLDSLFEEMFGNPSQNPYGYPEQNLGELLQTGPQNGLYKPAEDYGSGTPILRIDSFQGGDIISAPPEKHVRLSESEIEKYRLDPLDLVINRVNSPEHLGKTALIENVNEATVYESNMMRMSVKTELIRPVYLLRYLMQPYAKSQIATMRKDAINQSSINQGDVRSLRINLPPITKQQAFEQIAVNIREQAIATKKSAKLHEEIFSSLQQQLFAGML